MRKDLLILGRNKGECCSYGLCYLGLKPGGVVKIWPWGMERKWFRKYLRSGPWGEQLWENFRGIRSQPGVAFLPAESQP